MQLLFFMVFETFSGVRRTCRTHSARFKDKDKSFFRMRGCEPPTAGRRKREKDKPFFRMREYGPPAAGRRRSLKLQSVLLAGTFPTTLPQALPTPSMWKSPLRAVHVPSLLNAVSASLALYSDRLYRISGVEKPMESSLKTLKAKLLCFRPALRAPPLLVLFIFF